MSEAIDADLSAHGDGRAANSWRKAPVTGRMAFGFAGGEPRAVTLDGKVVATVTTACQRCLQPFEWQLETGLRLVFVGIDDRTNGFDGFEPWEVDVNDAQPLAIVDEALVMAMPLSACHDELDQCVELSPRHVQDVLPGDDDESTTMPFATLRQQMNKGSKD